MVAKILLQLTGRVGGLVSSRGGVAVAVEVQGMATLFMTVRGTSQPADQAAAERFGINRRRRG